MFMVTLDYLFDAEELKKLEGFEYDKLTETDLDYRLLCGSIYFRVNGVSFDAPWKWVPLFDFCVRVNEILSQLKDTKRAVLEFTENEATIVFERESCFVSMRAAYASSFGSCRMA